MTRYHGNMLKRHSSLSSKPSFVSDFLFIDFSIAEFCIYPIILKVWFVTMTTCWNAIVCSYVNILSSMVSFLMTFPLLSFACIRKHQGEILSSLSILEVWFVTMATCWSYFLDDKIFVGFFFIFWVIFVYTPRNMWAMSCNHWAHINLKKVIFR